MKFHRHLPKTACLFIAAVLAYAFIAGCGGDDTKSKKTFPPDSCQYTGCKVTCIYNSVPDQNNSTVQIDHNIEDGFVDSTKEDCTNSNLYRSFENVKLWEVGGIDKVCDHLIGYQDPTGEDILFECATTKFHPAD